MDALRHDKRSVYTQKAPKPTGPFTPGVNEAIEVWICRQYSELARKRRDGAMVEVAGAADDGVVGMLVMSVSPRELTVVNIVGVIRPEDFTALGGRFGIPKINLSPRKEDEQ